MKKIRMGIIGFGIQGSTYARFLSENKVEEMELGGICDIDSQKEILAKEEYPQIPFFNDYIELIESKKVDAVITTVPHYLHPIMGIEAIKRKMPVICEKPAGVYTKQVRQLNDFSLQNPDVPFAIMFNQRTNPLYQDIKRLIDEKAIGNIRRTNWIINNWWRSQAYYDQSEWRATWGAEGGGVLVNQAPHQLDMIQWICGKPKKVFATAKFGAHRNIVVENDVTATLDYGNGATGVFITCTHDLLGTDRFEIDGDKGKIVIENSNRATIWKLNFKEDEINAAQSVNNPEKLSAGVKVDSSCEQSVIEYSSVWGDQHCEVLKNFASHILHSTPLLAPGQEGIHGVRLANAILLSAWLGKEVDYDFDEDLFISELNKRIEQEGKYPLITNSNI